MSLIVGPVPVVIARLHPPLMLPEPLPAGSLNTYNDQTPLGDTPLNAASVVP